LTLNPSASLLNLKKSLEIHLETALTGSGLTLDWEGTVRNLSDSSEIVQPRLRLVFQQNMGKGPTGAGAQLRFNLSFNIFVRDSGNAGRLAEIRDLLVVNFLPGGRIAFKDYSADPVVELDKITIRSITVDQPLPTKEGYLQHNLTIAGDMVQDWAG
jgi:hypothetical protein